MLRVSDRHRWRLSPLFEVGPRDVKGALQQTAVTLPQRFFDHNKVSGLRWLRRCRPFLWLGPRALVVARRDDVFAVLDDTEAFPPPYVHGVASGFVLGLTGDDFRRHRAALCSVLRAEDVGRLEERVAQLATQSLDGADPDRTAVGRELVRPVFAVVVREYLGVVGPDPDTLTRWSRAIFQDIFLNNARFASIGEKAEATTELFRAAVRGAIKERDGRPHTDEDDVLARLLALEDEPEGKSLSEPEIVDTIIGLAVGWLWHGAKAALLCVDGLLDDGHALDLATTAAVADDVAALRHVLLEVLRFRPVQVGLPRVCARATTLGAGTPFETDVPAGTGILAGTHSAMWDGEVVPDPHRFDPTRATEQYVVFGHGPHRCMGEDLMLSQLPALLAPLLRREGLRRADGRWGTLSWDGPTPDDLVVAYSS